MHVTRDSTYPNKGLHNNYINVLKSQIVKIISGTVDGHYKVNEDMILIWVDAHADINTNKTSDSGSVHGMPVALLVTEFRNYWPYLPTMDWQNPV